MACSKKWFQAVGCYRRLMVITALIGTRKKCAPPKLGFYLRREESDVMAFDVKIIQHDAFLEVVDSKTAWSDVLTPAI